MTVLNWAHLAIRECLRGEDGVGAFTRRGPNRPNPNGLPTGMLLDVDGGEVRVTSPDAVDSSPVLDVDQGMQNER